MIRRDYMNWRVWLPSRGNVLFTTLMVIALVWVQRAGAFPSAAPVVVSTSLSTIPYQGRLADAAGAPITTSVAMIFRLYASASGGTALWEERWENTTLIQVNNGLFNVMLGTLKPIPQNVIAGNTTLWLGITVGTDNEMDSRVQLGSVAYAIHALTVPDSSISTSKLGANSVSTIKLIDSAITSIKIADNSIATADIADGAINSAKILDGSVSNADVGGSSINSVKIIDGSVANIDIADNSINSIKISDNTVSSADISNGAVSNIDMAASSINSGNIVDGSIANADLGNSSVNSPKLTLTSNYVVSNTGPFLTTTSFQQIPGVSATVNPTTSQYAYVYAMMDAVTTNSSGTIVGYIFIDGSGTGTPITVGVLGQTQRSSSAGFARIALSPGSHTITLRVLTEVANGATVYTGAIMYFLAAQ
jgi:hypothetical protein